MKSIECLQKNGYHDPLSISMWFDDFLNIYYKNRAMQDLREYKKGQNRYLGIVTQF